MRGTLRGTLGGKGEQCERETRKQQTGNRSVESVELSGSGPGPDWGRLRRRSVCVCDCVATSSRPTHRGTTGTIPSPFGQRLARPSLPDTVRRDFPSTRIFLYSN
ncbi:unnamed protein product [Ixodes hexagonus]